MPMSPQPLESRMEALEDHVTRLDTLPARMDSVELQIVQLRGEMHGEFSVVRTEIREAKEETRRQMREEDEKTRQLMRELNDETRRHMLVLHEEVVGRIALLQEGLVERRPRKKRKS
jgi:hypothetical protein